MKKIILLIMGVLVASSGYAQGPELVTNGDFESATPDGWYSGSGNGLNIVTETSGNRLNQRDNLPTGGNVFAVNISQIVNLENGKKYQFQFDARTNVTSRTLVAGLGQSGAPFAALVNPPFTLTNTFQTFTRNITINYGDAVTDRVIFDMAGGGAGSVFIDNVSVTEILPVTGDVYINDNSLVGDVFCSAIGQDIGTATGSTSLPYKTITDLFSDRIIAPGATIHLDTGTYSGRITFSDTEDGTTGNIITIKGAGTDLTTLTSPSSGGSLLSTNGADYMTFEDMTITGGNELNAILVVTNSTNCTFNNLNITTNNRGIAVTTGCNFTTITQNKINGDNVGGLDYGIWFTSGASSNHTVSNNMVSNFAQAFRSDIISITDCNIYHNSFYANRYGFVGYVTNWDIRNNIFYTTSNIPTDTAFWYGQSQSPAILDYNLYYRPNGAGAVTRFNPTIVYTSLADFVTATAYEDNGVEGNPLFTSTTDLHLQLGSPAIAAGTDVGVTEDIDGDVRPLSGTFDMGADEFAASETCDDGLLNNGETSVDCGGPNCSPCSIVLEDFENPIPAGPTGLNPGNGAPQPIIVPDPLFDGVRGDVLQVVTLAAAFPWQQAELTLQNDFLDLRTNIDNNKEVSIDWYSETPFDAFIRADDLVPGSGTIPAATAEAAHGGGGWQTLVFDFSNQAQPSQTGAVAPDGVYRKLFFFNLWDITSGDFLNPNPTGSVASTTYVDTITLFPVNPNPEKCSDGILNNGETEVDCGGPNCVPCETCDIVLGATTTSCDTLQPGTNDDTYTATIDFTGGLGANTFTINATSGTVGGDDPNAVAFGTITITGITEGTDITVTVDNTADGGFCSLSANIMSPECIPTPCAQGDLLEDFEGSPNFGGFNGLATDVVNFPGQGNVLRLTTAPGGAPFQGVNVFLTPNVTLTTDKTMTIDLYSTSQIEILAKVDLGIAGAPPSAVEVVHGGSGWETIAFSFTTPRDNTSSPANGTYPLVAFFPLWDTSLPGNGGGFLNPATNSRIIYIDNIIQGTAVSRNFVYDNNVWSPNDPTGISGCLDTIEIVSGNINITADTEADNLTIQPGASVTVNSGITLETTTVDLNSTSQQYSSLIVEGALEGTVNYNRYTASVGPVGTNDLIASPVSGQNFGSFAAANPNLAELGPLRVFGPYETNNGTYVNYDITGNASTEIVSGIGYRAATADGSPLTFKGTALTGDLLDVPISDASAGSAWNLIGNPYPSYLDFATFFAANQTQFDADGAFQAIYGYDGSATNGWTVWNSATIVDNTVIELIAPGQSFFVKSKTDGGLVDFTTGMRTSGSSDDFILGRSANSLNVALSNLTLTSSANSANTNIYFIEGTTRGLDPGYDAGAYFGASGGFSIFTNLVEDNEGLDMTIQSLPYNDFNDVVIPVGVNASSQGQLTIGLGDNSTVPFNVNVYLEDTLENTLTLLNTSDYTFTPTTNLFGTGRFFLRYSSDTLSLNTNEALDDIIIFTNASQNNIIIKGILTAATQTDLYDIQGRLVLSEKLDQSSITNAIDVSSISSGIYIVQVSNKNSTKTQKLIIK